MSSTIDRTSRLIAGGCLLAIVILGDPAFAQAPASTIYPASDFAAFNPRTALDIVERTPGFVLLENDETVRGLAGAGSNILIDGARPSSKSGGVRDVLRGIPADRVERIELLRNANLADAQGQALVLNIVRVRGGASGTWSAALERNGRGMVYPRLEATAARDVAGWDASIKLNGFWEEYPFETERLFTDPGGAFTAGQHVFLPSTLTEAFVSGEAARDVFGGRLKLSGRFGRSQYYFGQSSDQYAGRRPDDRPEARERLSLDSMLWVGELGAEFARPVGDWSWTSIALVNVEDNVRDQNQRTRRTADDRLLGRAAVYSASRPFEAVARTRFASPQTGRFRTELGGEVAYNRLESRFRIVVDEVETPIPAANVTVEEWRGEAFANATFILVPTISLEGGLAAEASRLSVSGDADNTQDFTFLKPSAAVAWRPDERWLFRAGARTTVGQLDFGDFAASAELNEDQTQAGNPDIRPGRTVRYSISADYRGGGDLAFNLELFHEDREDVLEQVLLPSGAPGLANAGDATYRGIKATATLPLDRLWTGARLSIDAQVLDTAFEDPVTGETRDISGASSPRLKLDFRRDQPDGRWSWGVNYVARARQTDYLLDEFTRYADNAGWGGFVETRAFGGLTVNLRVQDVNGQETVRRRHLFERDRAGPLRGYEDRLTQRGEFVTLTVSGRF